MKKVISSMILMTCLSILSTFGQQKIDLLGSFDRTQPIKLSEIAKSAHTIQLETTDDCLLVPEKYVRVLRTRIYLCL